MVFRVVGLSFLCWVLIGCKLEPNTPVIKPTDFDKEVYAKQIKKERDSIQQNKHRQLKQVKKPITDSTKTIAKNQTPFKITTDTIPVKIVYGKAKIDTVKTAGQRMVFEFNSDTANKLSLKISAADTLANLRINQIIDSKGNSDGPFGRELEYEIKEKGVHKVVISESQMAGEPWAGGFTFEVRLKW